MQPDTNHTAELEDWLDQMRRGNVEARNKVIEHTCERLRILTRKMLRSRDRIRRWAETDDVLQNAMMRLHRSLGDIKPDSVRQFYKLATLQIRRELLDLARHHFGPQSYGGKHQTGGDEIVARHGAPEPDSMEEWCAFHEQVGLLPEDEREVFHLLWYEGLNQQEAASLVGVSVATIKRRWQSARLLLYKALQVKEAGK